MIVSVDRGIRMEENFLHGLGGAGIRLRVRGKSFGEVRRRQGITRMVKCIPWGTTTWSRRECTLMPRAGQRGREVVLFSS